MIINAYTDENGEAVVIVNQEEMIEMLKAELERREAEKLPEDTKQFDV